jgi:hypothetical protein
MNSRLTDHHINIHSFSPQNTLDAQGQNMASPTSKDSDTLSSTSTLTTTSTTDFAPKPTSKHNNFIALQTLLETPELGTTTSSTDTSQSATESAMMIKKIRRRKIYFGIGLTVFVCCSVLAAILVVIFGPRRVQQG